MDRQTDKREEDRSRKAPVNDTPVDESPLIRQRLRNLCELAITIGQKQGLLGNGRNNDMAQDLEGGQDVADKGNFRDCKVAPSGQDKAGD